MWCPAVFVWAFIQITVEVLLSSLSWKWGWWATVFTNNLSSSYNELPLAFEGGMEPVVVVAIWTLPSWLIEVIQRGCNGNLGKRRECWKTMQHLESPTLSDKLPGELRKLQSSKLTNKWDFQRENADLQPIFPLLTKAIVRWVMSRFPTFLSWLLSESLQLSCDPSGNNLGLLEARWEDCKSWSHDLGMLLPSSIHTSWQVP